MILRCSKTVGQRGFMLNHARLGQAVQFLLEVEKHIQQQGKDVRKAYVTSIYALASIIANTQAYGNPAREPNWGITSNQEVLQYMEVLGMTISRTTLTACYRLLSSLGVADLRHDGRRRGTLLVSLNQESFTSVVGFGALAVVKLPFSTAQWSVLEFQWSEIENRPLFPLTPVVGNVAGLASHVRVRGIRKNHSF